VKQGRSMVKRFVCILTCLRTRAVHIEVRTPYRPIPSSMPFDASLVEGVNRKSYTAIMVENTVGAAIGTDPHRRRTGDVNGRGGSDPQLSPSYYAGRLRLQRWRASYPKLSFASNWFRDSSTRCFAKDDCYVSGCWRQIQWLVDQFWRRWSREYLLTLLPRQKWTTKWNNIRLGDVVLIAGYGHPRNNWQMGRVCRVFPTVEILFVSAAFFPTIEILFDKWK